MNDLFKTGAVSPLRYFGLLALVLGVLFALLNPEGTTDRGFGWALVQWLAQAAVPMALGIGSHLGLHRLPRFDRLNPWVKLTVSGLFAALLFAPVAHVIDVMLGVDEGPLGWTGLLEEAGGVLLPVTFAWVAINAPFVLGYRWEQARPVPTEVPVEVAPTNRQSEATPTIVAPEPFFMTLVPADRRGEVISLKAELHYLTVATTRGRSMILYSLGDAIGELPPAAGIQTHRSYWAGFKHCLALERKGRSAQLKMSDGSFVPVSRNRLNEVKGAMKLA